MNRLYLIKIKTAVWIGIYRLGIYFYCAIPNLEAAQINMDCDDWRGIGELAISSLSLPINALAD